MKLAFLLPDDLAFAVALPAPVQARLVQCARRRIQGTVVEISNRPQFLILIVILLLIFKPQEITIRIKIKIKRRKVAKQSLSSMAVGIQGEG